MSPSVLFRLLSLIVFGFAGWNLSGSVSRELNIPGDPRLLIAGLALGGIIGFLIGPHITIRPFRWVRHQIKHLPAMDLLAGTVGLLIGLVLSALLAVPLSALPGLLGNLMPFIASACLAYLGATIMVMRQREILQIIESRLPFFGGAQAGRGQTFSNQVLLDTSAVIDGRIADISRTGFIQATLVVPRFVLAELQRIADSPDALRRNRGRRGLEMLNKLQKDVDVPLRIADTDYERIQDVDEKLIKMGKALRCPIITNDYNLNRVAELQGIRVLNINELANAVKSVVMPGEEMVVKIIQEGKEAGQGVAYLDDGTMVVVEGGRRHLNAQLDVVVTRVLQTVAGRMIFSQPKADYQSGHPGQGPGPRGEGLRQHHQQHDR